MLQAFIEGPMTSPNLWTDANFWEVAHAARLTLVTFDAKIPAREGRELPFTQRKLRTFGPAAV
jgi:hypothetical protein